MLGGAVESWPEDRRVGDQTPSAVPGHAVATIARLGERLPRWGRRRRMYARSGDLHIAYQVVGDGPGDLVYIPSAFGHVETYWEEPRSSTSCGVWRRSRG